MTPILERELQKLGLSEKEAKVYLAALELGPNPVQDIARKAGVNRATTYVMIEALTKRGLMTSFERGKKRLFNAEAPDRLLSLVRVQERELQEREREFGQVLPQLRAILSASGERPRVRFFEGAEGIRSIRDEILATDANDLWGAFEATSVVPLATSEHEEFERRIDAKGITQHILYTGRTAPDMPKQHPKWHFRHVPEDRFPFRGELIAFGSKVFAFTFSGKVIGIALESAELAESLRAVLRLAWAGAGAPAVAVSSPPQKPEPPALAAGSGAVSK